MKVEPGAAAEWGLTLEPAALALAARAAPGLATDRVPAAALAGLAAGLLRREAPGAVVVGVAVRVERALNPGETAWARATVAAVDDARRLATVDVAFTDQRGERVAHGSVVLRLP